MSVTPAEVTSLDSIPYVFACHACNANYDALTAAWCQCVVKERTLVCPRCQQCFCRADIDYKRNFWTIAPDALWERKQRSAREHLALADNPPLAEARRPLVLVVDDDREICSLATHLIGSAGFGCIHAANGSDGLALAREYRPDLILTDALMPKMDGRELCRLVKSDPDLAQTKVVIMSSVYTSGRFKREALSQFKADEYVAKPIDAKVLFQFLDPNRIEPDVPVENAWVPPAVSDAPPRLLTVVDAGDVPAMIVAPAPPILLDENTAEREPRLDLALDAPTVSPLRFTATELIRLRAIGLDADLTAVANRVPQMSAVDLIALRGAGVPSAFLASIDADLLAALAAPDLIALYCSGCDAEAINVLRRLDFDVREIVGIVGASVPLQFVRDVVSIAARHLTASDLMRLHCSGVEVDYIRSLLANGFDDLNVGEWVRLWTIGISAEYIEAARTALSERCTADELLGLWLTGVELPMLRPRES